MTLLDDARRDLRHGMRLLRRTPGFAAVVLTILAVAVGASVTVFSVVDAWLLRPLNFPAADRLVIGLAAQRDRPNEPAVFLFYRSYLGFKAQSRSLASVSAAFRRGYLVTGRGDASSALGMAVSEEFFDTMGVAPVLGRTLSPRDVGRAPATVLSYGFWHQQFGGARDVIGTTVTLNGEPHEIVGVMPSGFDVRMLEQPRGAQLWTLIKAGERGYDAAGMGPVALYARIRPGTSLATAQAELNRLQQRIEAPFPEPQRLSQFPVLLTRLQDDNTRTIRATLITVISAVGCLLLIACMNVGTLILGRGLGRMQEAAVRAALGSGHGRLVRQFLTESLLLATLGGAAGLGACRGGHPDLHHLGSARHAPCLVYRHQCPCALGDGCDCRHRGDHLGARPRVADRGDRSTAGAARGRRSRGDRPRSARAVAAARRPAGGVAACCWSSPHSSRRRFSR